MEIPHILTSAIAFQLRRAMLSGEPRNKSIPLSTVPGRKTTRQRTC